MENLFTIRVKHSDISVSLYSDLLRCKLIINTCFIVGWLCIYILNGVVTVRLIWIR